MGNGQLPAVCDTKSEFWDTLSPHPVCIYTHTHNLVLMISRKLYGSDYKESAWNVGDPGSISESGRSHGEGNGYPLQYSCLENPMDRGGWWATAHRITKSWTKQK